MKIDKDKYLELKKYQSKVYHYPEEYYKMAIEKKRKNLEKEEIMKRMGFV